MSALLAWILLGQTIVPYDLAAIGVVVLVLALAASASRTKGGQPVTLRALTPAIVSAICYGAGNVARAAGSARWPEPEIGGFLAALSGIAAYASCWAAGPFGPGCGPLTHAACCSGCSSAR